VKHKYLVVAAFFGLLLAFAPEVMAGDPLNPSLPIEIWGMPFKQATVIWGFAAALIIFLACWLWAKNLCYDKPSRGQAFLEMLVDAFDTLTRDGFGTKRRGRIYLPMLATLFMFIWMSNMMGLLPIPSMDIGGETYIDYNGNEAYDPGEPFVDSNNNGKHDTGFIIPEPEEPTSNVSTTLSLALLFVLIIGHGSAIRYAGIAGYIKDYFSPGGLIGVVMMPLNVVGKLAEIISISFRLFGNIFGGAVIISVVSGLVYHFVLPTFLYGFFGVFVGTVQAFVFTMLALTYISSGAAEEPDEELEAA